MYLTWIARIELVTVSTTWGSVTMLSNNGLEKTYFILIATTELVTVTPPGAQ